MQNPSITAEFLIWHVKQGTWENSTEKPCQTSEEVEMPHYPITTTQMKAVFGEFLDNKYGQNTWKYEYFLGFSGLNKDHSR